MNTFAFSRPADAAAAITLQASSPTAQQGATSRFLAGGTTLVDLMKLNVETPEQVVDINHLPLADISVLPDGSVKVGAAVRNSVLAHHPVIKERYPVLSQAILAGASPQLRNRATTAGNLLQRTRCLYFRDTAMPCNKRAPGSGCPAMDGYNRNLAILGVSDQCIASHPSDMCVAMAALEAIIHVTGMKGERDIPFAEFHLLPGNSPDKETVLQPGDLITHVILPPPRPGSKSLYLKLRDRASYEFALASAAVVVQLEAGMIRSARVAMGGIGAKPWRTAEIERALEGQPVGEATFQKAAEAAVQGASPRKENAFKVELAKRCLVHTLRLATQLA